MRARRICSPDKLQQELCFLKKVFVQNGYPVQLLSKLFSEPDIQAAEPEFGPDPCRVFLRLPWKGQISLDVARAVRTVVRQTYFATALTFDAHRRRR